MISFEEALDNILSRIQPLGLEKVLLLESLGRIIGEDTYARRDIPPLDNSAMDGYALRFEDIRETSKDHPVRLKVIEDLPAGFVSKKTIGKGQAIRIMTGAPIPKGADTVIPVEETTKGDGFAFILKVASPGENIRRSGEDVKKGNRVISKGDMIRPAEVGMLSSVGRSSVFVYQKPLVAILCTGDELVDMDEDLDESKIISSNSYTLAAQVKDCGAVPVLLGIARDKKEEIREKLRQGIRADVLISSAGVSVGDYDFAKDALGDLGMEMAFWQVSMKPGKPLVFGTIQGKPVFGLPGNPVSSMISFEEFVRPSLLKMMGHRQVFRPVVEAFLQEEIRKTTGRRHFIRAFISFKEGSYFATTTGDQGSGILMSMLKANGLIMIPENQEIARVGDKVRVQLLDAPFISSG
ncbi:MAG: hypothetical protein A2157_09335 [Deltaproteobacteria bacterium RBG_16_47_11]|nr:MAG: hypothetical protein A2157_09335 [Deltaproteobacteria bacterium RBG_16_47_11]